MSLLKQLLISVTVAMGIILIGTLWLGLNGAKDFLNNRLEADAQNAATSLALSLSQPGNQDPVTQELLISALFDSGQFQRISLRSPEGNEKFLLERNLSDASGAPPSWFDALLPLRVPTATAAVSDGWKQSGQVGVTPLDTPARAVLWRMTYQLIMLVLGAGVVWAVFAAWLIRWLQRALQYELSSRVREIAESGTEGREQQPASGPVRIKELEQVRDVIESVRERVRATSEEQTRQIETLNFEVNVDEITGLANRKFFINELRKQLRAPPEKPDGAQGSYGHVLIFRQRDLSAINQLHERSYADAWLRNVAETVQRVLSAHCSAQLPKPQLARLNGSDFVVLLAGYDGPDTIELIQGLRQALDALRIRTAEDRLCRWSYALTDYAPGCNMGQVLARLDHGLMRAESGGHDEVEYIGSTEYRSLGLGVATGENAWKSLIQAALADKRLYLSTHDARYYADDLEERYEASLMLRMPGDDSAISAFLFMPPAVRLGLSGACDLRAIELGLEWIEAHTGTLVLRCSMASLIQSDFSSGMEALLSAAQARGTDIKRLIVEVDAHGFFAYPAELDAFCSLATRYGLGIGVRRLAEQPAAIMRLHKVSINYIKLGGDLISGLLESPGATQLIAAITEAAIGQGVKIYAHDIPNAATAAMLREYGVLMPMGETFGFEEDVAEGGFVDH